jgi:hypothetical protein
MSQDKGAMPPATAARLLGALLVSPAGELGSFRAAMLGKGSKVPVDRLEGARAALFHLAALMERGDEDETWAAIQSARDVLAKRAAAPRPKPAPPPKPAAPPPPKPKEEPTAPAPMPLPPPPQSVPPAESRRPAESRQPARVSAPPAAGPSPWASALPPVPSPQAPPPAAMPAVPAAPPPMATPPPHVSAPPPRPSWPEAPPSRPPPQSSTRPHDRAPSSHRGTAIHALPHTVEDLAEHAPKEALPFKRGTAVPAPIAHEEAHPDLGATTRVALPPEPHPDLGATARVVIARHRALPFDPVLDDTPSPDTGPKSGPASGGPSGPKSGPSSQPASSERIPALSIEQYASFCASCAEHPERAAETHRDFGVASYRAREKLDAHFRRSFAESPELRKQFDELYEHYRQWFRRAPR